MDEDALMAKHRLLYRPKAAEGSNGFSIIENTEMC